MGEAQKKPESAWSALAMPLFRALWIASIVSNIGTWMQNVAATWLMTTLTPSPVLVALMQTATSLPIFLLVLPAGAMADAVDRRRLLIATQAWMLAVAAALSAFVFLHWMSPAWLLCLTFLLDVGSALSVPAWQAMLPELVPRQELSSAVTMNGVSVNLARAAGPAIGGLLVAAAGPGPAFALNAASFLAVIAVLYRWRREARTTISPAERIWGAVRAGARYVRHSPELHGILARVSVFAFGASSLWALLPLVATRELSLGSSGYGVLFALFGGGGVAAATFLPKLRDRFSTDRIVLITTTVTIGGLLLLAFVRVPAVAGLASAAVGAAWMNLLSTMNITTQTTAPPWVRARALAVYYLAFQGWFALGSVVWGAVAQAFGLAASLAASAGVLFLGLALLAIPRFKLAGSDGMDFEPSIRWPGALPALPGNPEDGPVMVTVEYKIDPARSGEFVSVMRDVRRMRGRDGAFHWGIFRDLADPGRYLETFLVESWAEHLRQHERMTVANRRIEARAIAFHLGPAGPLISHLIAGDSGRPA